MRLRWGALTAVGTVVLASACGGTEAEGPGAAESDTLRYLAPYDSIGVAEGDTAYVFGDVWGACSFPDGTVGVLDRSMGVVRLYDADGEHIRSLRPVGTGPGELGTPDRIDCDSGGNIMLASFYDRKMVWLTPSGEPMDEIVLTGGGRSGPMKAYAAPDTGFVAITMVYAEPDSAGTEVALFRGSTEPVVSYARRMALFDPHGLYQRATGMVCGVDGEGRVAVADMSTERYEVVCHSPDGDTLFVIERPFEPVRRSREEMERDMELARQNWLEAVGSLEGFEFVPREYERAITALGFDGEGRLWVRSGTEDETFHVYDASGEHLYDCGMRMPEWQEPGGWSVRVGRYGMLASTGDPELFPVVYMLEEVSGAGSSAQSTGD